MLGEGSAFYAAGAYMAYGDFGTYLSGEICGVFVGIGAAYDLGSAGRTVVVQLEEICGNVSQLRRSAGRTLPRTLLASIRLF